MFIVFGKFCGILLLICGSLWEKLSRQHGNFIREKWQHCTRKVVLELDSCDERQVNLSKTLHADHINFLHNNG